MVEYITKDIQHKKPTVPTEPKGETDDDGALDPNIIAERIFLREDKDGDGYISYKEFSGPKRDEL